MESEVVLYSGTRNEGSSREGSERARKQRTLKIKQHHKEGPVNCKVHIFKEDMAKAINKNLKPEILRFVMSWIPNDLNFF